MSIARDNKNLQLTLPAEVVDSMNRVVEAYRKRGCLITKSMLVTSIYIQWLQVENKKIEEMERRSAEESNA